MADLLALANVGFQKAKAFGTQRRRIHVMAFVGAASGILIPSDWHPIISYVLALLSLSAEAWVWFIRYQENSLHALSERARRAAIVMDSFGTSACSDVADLLHEFGQEMLRRK